MKRGITVGLGVDGGASNDSGNMLAELRMAMLVHRIQGVHPGLLPQRWLSAPEVVTMATRNGARLLKRDAAIGSLEKGKSADIAAFRTDGIGQAGASSDPLGALVYCGLDYRADLVMVAGRVRVRHGQVLGLEERQVVAQSCLVTQRLVRRAAAATGLDFTTHA